MSEKDLWLAIRRALIIIIRAIERRYGFGDYKTIPPSETDTITGVVYIEERDKTNSPASNG